MGINKSMTPKSYDRVWTSKTLWRPHFVTAAGTFNGSSHQAALPGYTLAGVWWFTLFDIRSGGPSTALYAGQYSFMMPEDYISGTDIKIRFFWTSSEGNATSEVVEWTVGFCRNNGSQLGGEAQTTYATFTDAINLGTGLWAANRTPIQTFSGTGVTPDSSVSIIILRNEDTVPDTADVGAYVNMCELIYQRQAYDPSEASSSNRLMTPQNFVPLYRNVNFQAQETYTFASNQDGSAAVVSTDVLLNSRWQTSQYSATGKECRSLNWIAPPDFKNNTAIKVSVKYIGSVAATTNVQMRLGIAYTSPDEEYSTEVPAGNGVAWFDPDIGNPVSMPGTIDLESNITFSPTSLLDSGDTIAIQFVRDGAAGADTYTGVLNVLSFTIHYQSENEGIQTI